MSIFQVAVLSSLHTLVVVPLPDKIELGLLARQGIQPLPWRSHEQKSRWDRRLRFFPTDLTQVLTDLGQHKVKQEVKQQQCSPSDLSRVLPVQRHQGRLQRWRHEQRWFQSDDEAWTAARRRT